MSKPPRIVASSHNTGTVNRREIRKALSTLDIESSPHQWLIELAQHHGTNLKGVIVVLQCNTDKRVDTETHWAGSLSNADACYMLKKLDRDIERSIWETDDE